ncbi:MAG: hypothetical protein IJU94_06960 [Clostridia bacterium]|nr:hypothetical protein [Clostridia bacterium]
MTRTVKSALSALLSVIMIAAIFAVPGVFPLKASAEETIAITVETVEAQAGAKNVKLKVFIPTGWAGIGLTFNFDPSKLTFKRFEQNPAVQHQARDGEPNVYALNRDNAANGEVVVSFASAVIYNGVEGYCNVDVDDDTVYDYFGSIVFDVADGATGFLALDTTVDKLVIGRTNPQTGMNQNIDLPYSLVNGGIQIAVAPHDCVFGEWQVRTPATCASAGEKVRFCSICGAEETGVIGIDPDAHAWGEWTHIEGRDGWEQRVCGNNAEHVEEREIPFDGVDIVIETVEAQAGAKNVGLKVFIPTGWAGIGLTFNFDPSKLTFKRFEQNMAVQHQARDGEPNVYALNRDNAAGGEVVVAFASGVIYNGVEGYCNVDADDGTAYDYFGTIVFDVAAGVNGFQSLNTTVDKLVIGITNPVTGLNQNVDVPYRLTQGGINVVIAPHDCVFGEWEVRTPATCSAAGEEVRTCSVCGEEETRLIPVDPDAHSWGKWTPIPGRDGWERRVCANDPSHFEEREHAFEGIDIVVESVEAKASTKNVGLKVFIPTGWSAIGLTFRFDPAKLTFKRFEQNPAVQHQARDGEPNVYALNKENAANGVVLVSFASAVVYNGVEGYCNVDADDGQAYDYFGTIVFDVAADAEGSSAVTAEISKLQGLADGVQTDLDYRIFNGGISIHVHNWGEWYVSKEPTPFESGEETRVCPVCGETETRAFIPVVVEIVEADAGDSNVGVKVFIPTGWSAIGLTFRFDPAKLTFKRFEQNPAVQKQARDGEPNVYVLNKENAASGVVLVSFASAVVYNGVEGYCNVDADDGQAYDYFGTLFFNVADDAKGLNDVTASVSKLQGLADGEQIDLNCRITDGGVGIHEFGEWTEVSAPACTEPGEEIRTCPFCDEVERRDIPALGHNWSEWNVTTAPTCEGAGAEARTCSRCGETETRELSPLGHIWVETSRTEPTCTGYGRIVYTCSRCSDTSEESIDPLGHDWGEPAYVWADDYTTCTATRVCRRNASHVETQTAETTANVTEPTCTEAGKIIYSALFTNPAFAAQIKEIATNPLGHDWIETGREDPTCVRPGTLYFSCRNDPDHTKQESIPVNPDAHTWSEWETVTPNTYYSAGVDTRICTGCMQTETRITPIVLPVSMEFTTSPVKTVYTESKENLDFTGAVVTLDYDNNTSRTAYITAFENVFTLVFDDGGASETCAVTGFDNTVIGVQTVSVTYKDVSASVNVEVVTKQVSGIEIIEEPTKVRYEIGESLTLNGGKLVIYYDNDTSETVNMRTIAGINVIVLESSKSEKLTVTGFDSESRSVNTVTVEYSGFSDTFTVLINIDKGDPDGDGEITVADSLRALRIAALLDNDPDPIYIAACDVDKDGEITVADALKILRVAALLADPNTLG